MTPCVQTAPMTPSVQTAPMTPCVQTGPLTPAHSSNVSNVNSDATNALLNEESNVVVEDWDKEFGFVITDIIPPEEPKVFQFLLFIFII